MAAFASSCVISVQGAMAAAMGAWLAAALVESDPADDVVCAEAWPPADALELAPEVALLPQAASMKTDATSAPPHPRMLCRFIAWFPSLEICAFMTIAA
jgi:hypothetical protein